MKKRYPSRQDDRWEHALIRPLTRKTKFEVIELMRADLFEYLDVLTTDPYDDKKGRVWLNNEIQRVADRLKKLTPIRAKALGDALEARRIEFAWLSESEAACVPHCGPLSTQIWEQVHELWEDAR
jgi:hypothetical protein